MQLAGLDEIDNQILSLLIENARYTYSEIGERIGLSRVSVKNRMESLEREGVIRGYSAVIDPSRLPEGRRFFIDIVSKPEYYHKIIENLAAIDYISRVYSVTGTCRVRGEGYTSSVAEYEELMKLLDKFCKFCESVNIYDSRYVIKDTDGGIFYGSEGKLQQD